MEDILPEIVIQSIRDHYYAGVTAAELGYRNNAADEDSLTGALGQSLLTPGPISVMVNGEVFAWQTYHFKIRGRGRGAPEKDLGTDGIFQIDVFDNRGRLVRRKGLLFQAKKEWTGFDSTLLEQTRKLVSLSKSSVVIDYSPSGFSGFSATDVVAAEANRRELTGEQQTRLAAVLGDEFARCRRGEVGVSWDPDSETLVIPGARRLPLNRGHVIRTIVRRFVF